VTQLLDDAVARDAAHLSRLDEAPSNNLSTLAQRLYEPRPKPSMI